MSLQSEIESMGKTREVWAINQKSMRWCTVNFEKLIAGSFAGAGALLLIYQGYITEGAMILSSMVAFFIGDLNGQKKAKEPT